MYPSEPQQVLETAHACGWNTTIHWERTYDDGTDLMVSVSSDDRAFICRWHVFTGYAVLFRLQKHLFHSPDRRGMPLDITPVLNDIRRHRRAWVVGVMPSAKVAA